MGRDCEKSLSARDATLTKQLFTFCYIHSHFTWNIQAAYASFLGVSSFPSVGLRPCNSISPQEYVKSQ